MEPDLKNIIKNHRKISGLTQAELAKLAGVGKTVIFDIEHGKETVQFDTLKKVFAALNIKLMLQSPVLDRAAKASIKEPVE
jgi:y4mF family transcriptional regulator